MKRRDHQRGVALIIVLMLVAALGVTALALTQAMTRATRLASAASLRDEAVWALVGAEQAALVLLVQQDELRPGVDTLDEEWLRNPIAIPLDIGVIEARFYDRSACFNINQLVQKSGGVTFAPDPNAVTRFGVFLEALGSDRRTGETLANALVDFMDSNETIEPGGAEDYQYNVGTAPYVTAGGVISDLSELRAVRGWSRENYVMLKPFLCVRPGNNDFGLININMLEVKDAPLLRVALDGRVSVADLERLIENRPPAGYEDVRSFLNAPLLKDMDPALTPKETGRLSTAAAYIEFSAQIRYDKQLFEMTSYIVRAGTDYTVVSRQFGAKDL